MHGHTYIKTEKLVLMEIDAGHLVSGSRRLYEIQCLRVKECRRTKAKL
jgi:hypothetical protein